MTAGDTERFDCEECGYEFEVTYEPKCKEMDKNQKDEFPKPDVQYCPFCGEQLPKDE